MALSYTAPFLELQDSFENSLCITSMRVVAYLFATILVGTSLKLLKNCEALVTMFLELTYLLSLYTAKDHIYGSIWGCGVVVLLLKYFICWCEENREENLPQTVDNSENRHPPPPPSPPRDPLPQSSGVDNGRTGTGVDSSGNRHPPPPPSPPRDPLPQTSGVDSSGNRDPPPPPPPPQPSTSTSTPPPPPENQDTHVINIPESEVELC
ncbi:uncharacterized protein G2W53_028395 [Senna tora]|uniref:Uncharacterized protein n=1 Tax=Senna tora TaxID=362788 RepID=A0A834T5C4_9FABA|nr:uncharacterized protein G2W53_028395 [Senna tora]